MVNNVHERVLAASSDDVSDLIAGLASPSDRLWPRDRWPALRLNEPIGAGASGGHGPIRYFVEAYDPNAGITFRFTGPDGINGTHNFNFEELSPGRVRLRHTMSIRLSGLARLSWPLFFRWLHDALLEDLLDRAEIATGNAELVPRHWPLRVRALRRMSAYLVRGRTGNGLPGHARGA
jgi:hypothetical protein